MDQNETRRDNARKLAAMCDSKTEFARILGMEPSQVSQIIGPNPAKNIGKSIAKRIELAFKKPDRWLDVAHPEIPGPNDIVDAPGATDGLEDLVLPESTPMLQWVSEDEARILSAYRATDDRGRELIATIAESTPRGSPVGPAGRWPQGR